MAQDSRKDLQILTGDLNAEANAPELAGLWTRLTDAWTTAATTSGGPSTYPAVDPVKRIDFVTVGAGFRVRRASVPDEQAASDHRPVVADLLFRP
jgi:endonuclease/exonuclease/phosphatase family metal-dependent hydrolase